MQQQSSRGFDSWVAIALLVAVFLVVALQTLARHLPISSPIWTEEMSRWLWVWMVFFGMAEVERSNSHLRVEFFTMYLSENAKTILNLVLDTAFLVLVLHLIWIGYEGAARNLSRMAVTVPLSLAIFYASFPVAGFFIAYRIGRRILAAINHLKTGGGEAQ